MQSKSIEIMNISNYLLPLRRANPQQWTHNKNNLYPGVYYHRSIIVRDLIYILGGYATESHNDGLSNDIYRSRNVGYTNNIQIIDPITQKVYGWKDGVITLPYPVGLITPIFNSNDHRIYFFGGYDGSNTYSSWFYSNQLFPKFTTNPTTTPSKSPTLNPIHSLTQPPSTYLFQKATLVTQTPINYDNKQYGPSWATFIIVIISISICFIMILFLCILYVYYNYIKKNSKSKEIEINNIVNKKSSNPFNDQVILGIKNTNDLPPKPSLDDNIITEGNNDGLSINYSKRF